MNAFGVAIALTGTKTGEIMCCARSGSGVPDLGLALLPETSLTALCIGRDRQLWLDNVETDGGAHSATVAELRVRSVVVTPIRRADRVAGVLVVCATGAGAFSEMHRVRLQTTANQIAAVLEEKLRPAQERTPKLLPWIESRRLEPVADKVQPPRLPLLREQAAKKKAVRQSYFAQRRGSLGNCRRNLGVRDHDWVILV